MQEFEGTPQDFISTALGLMEFVSWRLVVTKVNELAGIQVQCVGPVFVFSTRVEDNELLIRTPPGGAKPSLVSNSFKNFRDRVIGGVPLPAALIDSVDDQIR